MKKNLCALQVLPVLVICLFTVCGYSFRSLAAEARDDAALSKVEAAASMHVEADDYDLDTKTGVATGTGHVKISYEGLVLEADRVRVNMKTKDIHANGNIFLYSLDQPELDMAQGHDFFWRGEELKGNFATREFTAGASKGRLDEWFAVSGETLLKDKGLVILRNVEISTCEYLTEHNAHYRIEAKEVIYNSKTGRLTAKNAVYKLGDVPVFYWPRLLWDTTRDGGNLRFRIGHSSNLGAFLSVSRRWRINENGETEFTVDLMSERGVGLGNETRLETEKTTTNLLLYGVADQDPPEDDDDMNRRFDVVDDRYRARLYHLSMPAENLSLRVNVDKLSDIDMLEEWFRRDFRNYRQPTSFADARFDHEIFTASLQVKARMNDFYSVSEKLPELRLDLPRQPVFGLPILHQGHASVAYLKMNLRDFDISKADQDTFDDEFFPYDEYFYQTNAYRSFRFDTVQMLYLPINLDAIRILPRAGLRLTYYEKTSEREVTDSELQTMFKLDDPSRDIPVNNISLYDDNGGNVWRSATELGLELSTKFIGTWGQASNSFLDIDGFRHIVQPYINYTYISEPSEDREHLMYFDEVDRLRGENFIRVGTNQRFQTRRETDGIRRVYTLLSWDTYADFHLETEEDRKHAGDFATRIRLHPQDQISLWGTALADMNDGTLRWFEVGTSMGDPNRLSVDVFYLVRDDERPGPLSGFGSTYDDFTGQNMTAANMEDTHSMNLAVHFRFDDLTSGSASYEFDFEESEMASQIYRINRDLHCWTGSIFVGEDYDDFVFGFALQLKAFPKVALEAGL